MPRFTIEQLLGRYLSLRPRSEAEVRKYLQNKRAKFALTPEDEDVLVQKYVRLGFINDEKFSESVSHSVVVNKAKGQRFVQQKLKAAGVDSQMITKTLEQIDPDEVQDAMAKRIAKSEAKLTKLAPKERKFKAMQILFSSGFNSSEIRRFLDERQDFR